MGVHSTRQEDAWGVSCLLSEDWMLKLQDIECCAHPPFLIVEWWLNIQSSIQKVGSDQRSGDGRGLGIDVKSTEHTSFNNLDPSPPCLDLWSPIYNLQLCTCSSSPDLWSLPSIIKDVDAWGLRIEQSQIRVVEWGLNIQRWELWSLHHQRSGRWGADTGGSQIQNFGRWLLST